MEASDNWVVGDGDEYLDYANGDVAFSNWCRLVDQYSRRFLDISFFEFTDLYNPVGYYCDGHSPLNFVRNVLVPALDVDMGCSFIEKRIAECILWGHSKY